MGNENLISTLDELVCALCSDYSRRKKEIEQKRLSRRTDTELRYLNYKIYDAAAETVGEENAELYIKEIGAHVGYAYSAVTVSERIYKEQKRRVKLNIAKKLHLKD